jgi:glutaredoxin-related protein
MEPRNQLSQKLFTRQTFLWILGTNCHESCPRNKHSYGALEQTVTKVIHATNILMDPWNQLSQKLPTQQTFLWNLRTNCHKSCSRNKHSYGTLEPTVTKVVHATNILMNPWNQLSQKLSTQQTFLWILGTNCHKSCPRNKHSYESLEPTVTKVVHATNILMDPWNQLSQKLSTKQQTLLWILRTTVTKVVHATTLLWILGTNYHKNCPRSNNKHCYGSLEKLP